MHGGDRWKKTDAELEKFYKTKELIIKMLEEGNPTINEIAEKSGMPRKNVRSTIFNLSRSYEIEIEKSYRNTRYHITKIIAKDESELSLFETTPVCELSKVMFKGDLLSWHIQNQIYEVETSRQLVEIAKQNGIKVFEYNGRGEVYYL